MSYLCGPLTREQIRSLTLAGPMDELKPPPPDPRKLSSSSLPPPSSPFSHVRPVLDPRIPQVCLADKRPGQHLRAQLLAQAIVNFRDSRRGLDFRVPVTRLAAFPDHDMSSPDWDLAESLDTPPTPGPIPAQAHFEELPPSASRPANYSIWEKNFYTWLLQNYRWETLHCPELKIVAQPEESETEFRSRVAHAGREVRDAQIEKIRSKYQPRRAALETRLQRAEFRLRQQKEEARQARWQSVFTVGSSLLGTLLSKNKISSTSINRAGSAMRGVSRAMKQASDIRPAEESVESLHAQIEALDADFAAESAALSSTPPAIEVLTLKPSRSAISDLSIRLAWVALD